MCNNIERTDLFSSTVTGETYKINHYFNCDSKCLVCLITCWTSKLQYKGQTCDIFQKSIGTIIGAVLEKQRSAMNPKKKYLHEHFFQDDHHGFLNTVQVILTDKTKASDPTKSKYFPPRLWNSGLVSSGDILTSWGEGASLALVGHPSSDGITIKMPYGVHVLHRPASHHIFSCWVG